MILGIEIEIEKRWGSFVEVSSLSRSRTLHTYSRCEAECATWITWSSRVFDEVSPALPPYLTRLQLLTDTNVIARFFYYTKIIIIKIKERLRADVLHYYFSFGYYTIQPM